MRVWCLVALLVFAATSTANAAPILDPLGTTLPRYQGAPAVSRPLSATVAPRNPHLARDPGSNIHNDTWMTDAYRRPGPLGRSPRAFSGAMPPALCGSLTFHSRGYLVSVCPSIGAAPQARVIDPVTLEVLATYDMPTAPDPPGTRAYRRRGPRRARRPAGVAGGGPRRPPRRRAGVSARPGQRAAGRADRPRPSGQSAVPRRAARGGARRGHLDASRRGTGTDRLVADFVRLTVAMAQVRGPALRPVALVA